ncbi:MAG: hypothetical protein ACI9YH_002359 [Colwellia sp.]
MKLLYILILKLSLLFLCCFSSNTEAKDIVIGATLNLSGVNSQYSIDYKNAIDAYIESYNKLDKLKTYQLKLLVLDDQGTISRARDNIERLITRKQVIAIINPYQGLIGEEIIKVAVKLETLVLSSTFACENSIISKAEKRYSYYFSTLNIYSHPVVSQLFEQLAISNENLFYFYDEKIIKRSITANNQNEMFIDTPLINLPLGTTIIINERYVDAAIFINNAFKSRPDFNFVVLPYVGAEVLITLLDKNVIENIRFVVDIPVHLQLPLHKEFGVLFSKEKKEIRLNSQSLKGVIAAKVITESVFNVVNALKADSLIDVVTLPFQVLERMVGWVKHSTSDLDRELIIDEIRNIESYEIGLEETISYEKNGLGLSHLWLLEISQGQLVLRGNE